MVEDQTIAAPAEAQPGLYKMLADLLIEASEAIDRNQGLATDCINRAVRLLPGPWRDHVERGGAVRAVSGGLVSWQMTKLERFVAGNLDARITTTELADLVQLSTGHFSRAFRVSFGMSPRAYVVDRRVARAKHLMLTSDLPLSEIALACGLTDQAHFCHIFTRTQGISPAAWRRRRLQFDPVVGSAFQDDGSITGAVD